MSERIERDILRSFAGEWIGKRIPYWHDEARKLQDAELAGLVRIKVAEYPWWEIEAGPCLT